MIKSLQLSDFQSHKDSTFNFSPGVNVITGTSDSGKSAAFRALYWLWLNRPSGTGFIRLGTKETNVSLIITKGKEDVVVAHKRNATSNEYTCGKESYTTVGKDVPEDVQKTLNLQEINVQRQLDPPFLLLDSPGNIATIFNRFTKLDKGDAVINILLNQIRSAKSQHEDLSVDIKKIEDSIATFTWLESFEELVGLYEEVVSAIDAEKQSCTKLVSLRNTLTNTQDKLTSAKAAVARIEPRVQKATKLFTEYREIYEVLLADQKTSDQLNSLRKDIIVTRERIADTKKAPELFRKGIQQGETLKDAQIQLDATKGEITKLTNLVGEIKRHIDEKAFQNMVVSQLIVDLKIARQKLAQFLESCPTCGQKLTESARAKVLENLS